jgi:hypothetical protein
MLALIFFGCMGLFWLPWFAIETARVLRAVRVERRNRR